MSSHTPPAGALGPRLAILAFITGMLGLVLHIALVRIMGPEIERSLPLPAVALAAVLLGCGCAALSEAMRQTNMGTSEAWERGGKHMGRALLWGALTPSVFVGLFPVPAIGVTLAGASNAAPLTVVFGILSVLAFAAIMRVPVGYSAARFSQPQNRWTLEAMVLAGVWGAVLLLGSPILPDLIIA